MWGSWPNYVTYGQLHHKSWLVLYSIINFYRVTALVGPVWDNWTWQAGNNAKKTFLLQQIEREREKRALLLLLLSQGNGRKRVELSTQLDTRPPILRSRVRKRFSDPHLRFVLWWNDPKYKSNLELESSKQKYLASLSLGMLLTFHVTCKASPSPRTYPGRIQLLWWRYL